MSHTHDLFIKWLFIYNLSVLFRTRFLIYFWIRIGIEFLKSSISGSFSITIIFYQLISLLSHFTISSQKEPSYSNTLLRNLLSLISNFITHEFYFPQKTRTQFSRVLCHLITRITFPPFSNKIVLIFFFWDYTRIDFNAYISGILLKILPISIHYPVSKLPSHF